MESTKAIAAMVNSRCPVGSARLRASGLTPLAAQETII